MEVIEGKITGYEQSGRLTVTAQYENAERYIKRGYKTVLIGLEDGRTISPEQRRKAYALINEIAEWAGDPPEHLKYTTKTNFIYEQENAICEKMFSLSDCDMTTARGYITHLVELVLEYDVPLKVPLQELCDDIRAYQYACLRHKKCAVCGRRGELHHMEAIGMGNDRIEVVQESKECMCLCREHHAEYHGMGRVEFLNKYHFDAGVRLDKDLCKVWKVRAGRSKDGSKEAGAEGR